MNSELNRNYQQQIILNKIQATYNKVLLSNKYRHIAAMEHCLRINATVMLNEWSQKPI